MIEISGIVLKGSILGLAVSMPSGPVGLVMINRTIKRGRLSGFFSGLGIAAADTFLAIISAIGFSFIIDFIREERFILSLVAGILVSGVGLKVFLSNPVKEFRNNAGTNKSLWRDFYSVFIMSVTNPYSIFIFVAFFSGVHIEGSIKPETVPFIFVPGVFMGAMAWWLFLSYFVSRLKKKIRLRTIVKINRIAGLLIIAIGIFILLSLFTSINI